MKTLTLLLLPAIAASAATWSNRPPQAASDAPLAERFANPPANSRILRILHKQPDQPAAQDQMLRELAEQGFGGFVGNVSFDGYVDDETKWPAFLRGVQIAREAGMALWLYDECGYPSGSARDLTLKGHPDWAARGLLVAETNSSGGEVSLTLPPGSLVTAVALPVRAGVIALGAATNLADRIREGRLKWMAPPGDWRVFAMTDDLIYEGTHAAVSLAYKKPCIDLLRPETTARFLEVTHDRYAERLGRDLGRTFVSTFTDEPSLMNLWMRPMPWRVLPWSPQLEREFRKRRGGTLIPLLPALVADAGPAGAKARHDFWQTIGELVSENYFGQIQAWCRRHNLASGGHLLMEESLVSHVPLYGDFMQCARRLDAPSIDCLTSIPAEVPWQIARMMDSVAALEERSVTMCEVSDHAQRYRPEGDTRPRRTVTEDEIRGTCNRLLWGGIGTLTSYFTFTDIDAAARRRINEWVGRIATMTAGGHHVADVALLYPVESVWTHFVPARRGATDSVPAQRIERTFDAAAASLYAAHRDFDLIDSRAIGAARVRDGALTHGKLRWSAVVLPEVDTLPREAAENLRRFWERGGIVVALGQRPANDGERFPSSVMQEWSRALFGRGDGASIQTNRAGGVGIFLPSGLVSLLPALLDRVLERDAASADPSLPIQFTHRRVDDHDVFLAINDSAQAVATEVHFAGRGVTEVWDPATGLLTKPGSTTNIPITMGGYGALLFRGREPVLAGRKPAASSLPSLSEHPLPLGTPTDGHGEFVRSELRGDAEHGWTPAATLTKSAVDTHLFLSFPVQGTNVLRDAAGLIFDTDVPAGQITRAEILSIVRTRDGGEYLASTGRFLGESGTRRTHLAFAQFKPAGWSKSSAPLDPAAITTIRIGWGGYFGEAGESIVFNTKAPRGFRVQ